MSKSLSNGVCYRAKVPFVCFVYTKKEERPRTLMSVRMHIATMVMQPSHPISNKTVQHRETHLRAVTGLTEEMAAYSSFGALLAAVRENAHLTQDEIA